MVGNAQMITDLYDTLGALHLRLFLLLPHLGLIVQHWESTNQDSLLKERLLARLRMGHTNITDIHLIEHTPPPICCRCRSRYTIKHFILHCPQYAAERQPMTGYAAANRLPLTLPLVLGDSHPLLHDLLFTFLHKTRLELSI